MAQTRKFNTTVKIGAKTYAPGEDVPISAKGLNEADADNLDQVFGIYRAPESNAVDKRIAALTAERDSLADQVDDLTKERADLIAAKAAAKTVNGDIDALTSERDELVQKLKTIAEERDQLADDNATLADELEKLQDAGSADDAKSKAGQAT